MKRPLFLLLLLGLAAGLSAQEEAALVVQPTDRTVLLRWMLPDGALPDAEFVIERRGPADELQRIRVPSPLPRAEAITLGLIEDEQYTELLDAFSREDLPTAEEREARELSRAMLTLASFQRPAWGRVLGTLYEDISVVPGATYTYRVTTTVEGLEVVVGEELVTVGEAVRLVAIDGLHGEADASGINLVWELAEDGFVIGYHVYRRDPDGSERSLAEDGVFVTLQEDPETGELRLPEVFFQDTRVEPDATYRYAVAGFDVFGRETPRSDWIEVLFPDPEPLEVPVVTAVEVRDRAIELFWAVPEDPRVAGVGVVRSLDPLEEPELLTPNPLPASTTSWVDAPVEGGVSYYYALVTFDRHGRRFGPSSPWAARGVNLSPPSAPSNLTVTPTEKSLILTWEAPPERDVHGYQVFLVREDEEETFVLVTDEAVSHTTYTLEVPPGTLDELTVAVRAVNTSFVEGDLSDPVSGRVIDTVPPDRPILAAIRAGEGTVELSWVFTTDPDVAGYRVLRSVQGEEGFRVVQEGLSPSETAYVDGAVTPGLLHAYTVEAIDASGNVSEPAPPLAATPYRLTPPGAPREVRARLLDDDGVELTWEPPANDAILFYVVERTTARGRFVQIGDPLLAENLTFFDPTGRAGHSYRVVAIDTGGNMSPPSSSVVVEE